MFPSLRLVTAALFATVLLAFTFVFVSARVAHEAMGQRSARAHGAVQETMLLSRDLVFVTAVPETVAMRAAKPATKLAPGISTYVVTPPETAPSFDAAPAPEAASVPETKSPVPAPIKTASQKPSQDVSHDQIPQERSRDPDAHALSEKSAAVPAAPDNAPEGASISDSVKIAMPAPQADSLAASQAGQKTALIATAPDSAQEPAPGSSAPPASTQTEDAKTSGQPGTDLSNAAKPAPEEPAALAAAAPHAAGADASAALASKTAESKTMQPETAQPKIAEPTLAESKTVKAKTAESKIGESETSASPAALPHTAEIKPASPAPAVVAAPAAPTLVIAVQAAASATPAPPQASQKPSEEASREPSKNVALLENQSVMPADHAPAITLADTAPNDVVPDLSAAGTLAHVPLPKAKPAIRTIRSAAVSPAKPAIAKRAKVKAKPARKPKPVRRVVRQQIVRPAAPPPAPQPPPTPGFLFGN
jgi:hypothetical protein